MRPIFVLIVLLLFAPLLAADEVALYRGETTVQDKNSQARQSAMPRALENSLSRISGLRNLQDVPNATEALRQAEGIVLSWFYRSRDVTLPDGSQAEELRLVAEFSPPRVDELLARFQLPVWPAERPGVEVWLVVDDIGERQILPEQWRFSWESMARVAEDRGLPLVWPEADEEGMYPVDAQLLWGGYTEDLMGDGRTGVMIIAARREGATWSVRSNLQYREQSWAWRSQDFDLELILAEAMHQAVDNIAAANAIAASDLGHWSYEMTVSGLSDGTEYQRCLGMLSELGVVEVVRVVTASAGRFRFRLELNAMPQYLEEALELNRQLEPGEAPGEYRYLP